MKNQKGATIIEIIIYSLLSISLILVLTDVFSSLLEKSKESVSFSEVESDGKFISQKLLNHLPAASSVSIPANLGDLASTLSFTANGSSYSYYLSNSDLYLNENGTANKLNSYGTQVSNLTIQKLGNSGGKPVLKIGFNLKSTIIQPKGYEEKTYDLTIGTR